MNPVGAVILCGGQSSRMGEDKCFLRYHGNPQWQHLATMVNGRCAFTLVSCHAHQSASLSRQAEDLALPLRVVEDAPHVAGRGPMAGLLSAWEVKPETSLLVVACDYPLITPADLDALLAERQAGAGAVCFHHGSMDEPVVAVYEWSARDPIQRLFGEGEFSLRRALQGLNTRRIPAPEHLVSIDTPDQARAVMSRLGITDH